MTGYVIAINNIGAGYTAIISSFYPAFGTLMAVLLLKEKITPGRVVALIVALAGIIAMGYLSADTTVTGDPDHRTSGSSRRCVRLGQRGGAVRLGHARRRRGQRDRPADPRNHVGPRVPHRSVAHLRRLGLHVERHPESGHSGSGPWAALAGTCSYLFYYKGISSSAPPAAWR